MMAGPGLSGRRDHVSNVGATWHRRDETRKLLAIINLSAWIGTKLE
jgi:hypothetical protein